MTIRYSDTAGSNTAPYDTWAKAATDPQTIVDLAVAGDTNYYRGTFTQAATLDFDTNSGTSANPIYHIGMNASGVEDGTKYTLDGNSAAANNVGMNARSYVIMRNFKGINATASAWQRTSTLISCHQHNNEWSNSGADGLSGDGGNYRVLMTQIRCNGNATIGFDNPGVEANIETSEAIGNGSQGFFLNSSCQVSHSLIHNNTSFGAWANNSQAGLTSCTLDGNATGLRTGSNFARSAFNLYSNNGDYGINEAGSVLVYSYCDSFYNNSTAETLGDVYFVGKITMTGDPYTDRANDDFSRATDGEGVGISNTIGGSGATTTVYITSGGFPPEYTSGGGGARRSRGQYFGRG